MNASSVIFSLSMPMTLCVRIGFVAGDGLEVGLALHVHAVADLGVAEAEAEGVGEAERAATADQDDGRMLRRATPTSWSVAFCCGARPASAVAAWPIGGPARRGPGAVGRTGLRTGASGAGAGVASWLLLMNVADRHEVERA